MAKSSKKNATPKKKEVPPAPKQENVKFRNLAQWWRNFNSEHYTILPGTFPKAHSKRQVDDTGYKLIIRPQFQIYRTQHNDDCLTNVKKKEIPSKKLLKSVLHNTNYKEHNNIFRHHLSPGDSLQQYRELNAYSRSRLGKVNKKQLHKAATMMFRSRQEFESGRKGQKPYNPVKAEAPTAKKSSESPADKDNISERTKTPVIASKVARIKKNDKRVTRHISKTRLLIEPNKKALKNVDGLKKNLFKKVSNGNKPKSNETSSLSEEKPNQITMNKKRETSINKLKVGAPVSNKNKLNSVNLLQNNKKLTTNDNLPKIRQTSILPLVSTKAQRTMGSTSKQNFSSTNTVNVNPFNFSTENNFRSNVKTVGNNQKPSNYNKFGILASKQIKNTENKNFKSSFKNPSKLPSHSIKDSQIGNNNKSIFSSDSFLIVRSLHPKPENTGEEVNKDKLTAKNLPIFLKKFGLPEIEPKFKYSEKYPGKPKINTAGKDPRKRSTSFKSNKIRSISRNGSKKCDLTFLKKQNNSILKNDKMDKFKNFPKGLIKPPKMRIVTTPPTNSSTEIEKNHKKGNKITKYQFNKINPQKQSKKLTEFLVQRSLKLAKDSDEITKRLKVKSKGLDLTEFSKRVLQKYQ